MAALSEVRHIVVGADDRPQTDIDVTVRIAAPNGYLLGGSEVTAPAVFRTDDDGLVKMTVIRTSEYEFVGAVYEASWDQGRQKRYFTAPDVSPVNLRDVLAAPPSAGPGVVYTPGAAGRGIVGSPSYVNGVLQFTYSDGTTSTAAIPTGPPGPAGADGSGGPTGTSVAAGQPVISSGVGSASKFGRKRNDLVDRWLADPTGVVDASAALRSAIDASVAGDGPVTGAGTFLIASSTRVVCPNKTYIYGEGSGATTFKFTHIDGGLSLGAIDVLDFNGGIRGITLDGNNTTRNLLYSGHITGWIIEDLELIKSGWDNTSQATRDGSAAWIQEQTGNLDMRNVRINNHNGHGLIMDRGAGGHSWKRGRIGDCGKAGGDVHNFWARRTTPAGVVEVYGGYPNDLLLENVFIELSGPGALTLINLDAARNFVWRFSANGGSAANPALTVIRLGATSRDNTFEGCSISGSTSTGQDVSGMTLVKVVLGALGETVFGALPTKFTGAGVGFNIDNGPSVAFTVKPNWQTSVATRFSGTTTRVSHAYLDRYVEATPPVSSFDTRGILTYRNDIGNVKGDQLLIPNRGIGATSWTITDLLGDGFTPDWVGSKSYRKGQIVSKGGLTYRAKGFIAATVTTFLDANWEPQFGAFTLKYGTGWPAVRPVPITIPMTWIKTASAQVDPPSGLLAVGDIVYGPA